MFFSLIKDFGILISPALIVGTITSKKRQSIEMSNVSVKIYKWFLNFVTIPKKALTSKNLFIRGKTFEIKHRFHRMGVEFRLTSL